MRDAELRSAAAASASTVASPQAGAPLHAPAARGETPKILTSCPSCLQGLHRYREDANIEAEYIVVEMANHLLGKDWQRQYIAAANAGGIERVLL